MVMVRVRVRGYGFRALGLGLEPSGSNFRVSVSVETLPCVPLAHVGISMHLHSSEGIPSDRHSVIFGSGNSLLLCLTETNDFPSSRPSLMSSRTARANK